MTWSLRVLYMAKDPPKGVLAAPRREHSGRTPVLPLRYTIPQAHQVGETDQGGEERPHGHQQARLHEGVVHADAMVIPRLPTLEPHLLVQSWQLPQ
jgi:hypothetical protein